MILRLDFCRLFNMWIILLAINPNQINLTTFVILWTSLKVFRNRVCSDQHVLRSLGFTCVSCFNLVQTFYQITNAQHNSNTFEICDGQNWPYSKYSNELLQCVLQSENSRSKLKKNIVQKQLTGPFRDNNVRYISTCLIIFSCPTGSYSVS